MSAFTSSGLFGGLGFLMEPNRRWSGTHRSDWRVASPLEPSARTSARMGARRPAVSVEVSTVTSTHNAGVVIGEEIFRDVLVRERNRAERFDGPFVLLLVGLQDSVSPYYAAAVWRQTIAAIAAVVRETDVVGWVTRGQALGVILTELAPTDESMARDFESRIRRELTGRLDAQTVGGVAIRLHFNVRSEQKPADVFWPADPLLFGIKPEAGQSTVRDALKRAVDIVGSATLLLLLAPVFLVIAALIKLKSPGPVLFRQVRVGQKAKPFTMLKFRSMHIDADSKVHQQYVTQFIKSGGQTSAGAKQVFKLTNDPRITPLGHILRKTSVDELPQLWNVLRGDMSLVGPRPPLFYETNQYEAWHWRRVFDAKPGVTGLWQVTGRSRTTFDGMVRLDLRYVKTRSLWTDIKILLATPAAVINGKGAC
jgi:lipopolysaccharide/colanic/teichoic acid biosynthesis glycosyltransferase